MPTHHPETTPTPTNHPAGPGGPVEPPTPPVLDPGQDPGAMLAAALAYAARGWHVIPLVPGGKRPAFPDHDQTRCNGTDPRCAHAGRHLGWDERATTDPERIARCWSSPAGNGLGIACGPSGLVVIDCDVPKGDARPDEWRLPGITTGADVLAHVAESLGEQIPPTYTVATPSGGRHLYYRAEPGVVIRNSVGTTRGPLGWLVDIRASGGQVVAPPTTTPAGSYVATDPRDPAPLPAWIARRLRPAPVPTGTVTARLTTREPGTPTRRQRYLDAAVTVEVTRVAQAVEGERNHTLFRAAIALGQLVAGGELDAEYVRAVLLSASRDHFTDPQYPRAKATTTITSGLRRGAGRPRRIRDAA